MEYTLSQVSAQKLIFPTIRHHFVHYLCQKKNENKRAKIIPLLLRYLLRRHPFQLSFPLTLQHPPTPLKAGFSHSEEGGGHKYISLFSPLVLNVLPSSLTSSPKSQGSSYLCS